MSIRALIVDDHAILREGIEYLLSAQRNVIVIGSFGDSREALRFAVAEKPDVAIVDIEMPRMNGIELLRQLRNRCPKLRVVVLSVHEGAEYVSMAFEAGAMGYVIKGAAGIELVDALRAVLAGKRYVAKKLRTKMQLASLRSRNVIRPLANLSRREREVLQLVVEGMTSVEVASRLELSRKSVETYRSRLMTKLGVEDIVALVKFAIRHGVTGLE
jgi:DNA-binding NarL/FixJ family response regulator